jgi:enoyl-CoA hydratase
MLATRTPVTASAIKRATEDRDARTGKVETTLSAGVADERKALYLAFASEDAHEGLTAFVEKRKPEFKGR